MPAFRTHHGAVKFSPLSTEASSHTEYRRLPQRCGPPFWMRSLLSAAIVGILSLVFFVHSSRRYKPVRITNTTLKILQLTDLHLGENAWDVWGPEQDVKTRVAVENILSYESPDLLVLSGDQLTANNVDTNATAYYTTLLEFLEMTEIRYAVMFGNHDDMAYDVTIDGVHHGHPAKTSRTDLLQIISSYPNSLNDPTRTDVVVPVYRGGQLTLQVMLLDSGGGSLPQEITSSQLDWYHTVRGDKSIPSVLFQHIPTKDFGFVDGCTGQNGDGGIAPIDTEDELDRLAGDPLFLAVGHNHGNSYCCPGRPVLCFGRHSGYGGYGKWDRGGRVFVLEFGDDGAVDWSTYVRLESGAVVDQYPAVDKAPSSTDYY